MVHYFSAAEPELRPEGAEDAVELVAAEFVAPGKKPEPVTFASQEPSIVDFDDGNPLLGRLLPDIELPSDEALEVVVETWSKNVGEDDLDLIVYQLEPGARPWREVARVKPLSGGSFDTPRPIGVEMIRLRVEGDYVVDSDFEFEVGGSKDPGGRRIDISVVIRAHVTLVLDRGEIATAKDVAGFAGVDLTLLSTGPSSSRVPFSGRPYQLQGKLDRMGRIEFGAIRCSNWSFAGDPTDGGKRGLEPFLVPLDFSFEPKAGERVTVQVPLERGVSFGGVVRASGGAPIEGAKLRVESPYGSGGRRYFYRKTDAQGRFRFGALPLAWDEFRIQAEGYLGLRRRADELSAMDPSGESLGVVRATSSQAESTAGLEIEVVLRPSVP